MIDDFDNQAATLRELVKKAAAQEAASATQRPAPPPTGAGFTRGKVPYTIAVTSGKGGVGKTLITVNLAMYFASQGLKVLIIDADLGLANIDVVLGLTPEFTIEDVMAGHKQMDEIALAGPGGVTILPAASGVAELSNLTEQQRMALMDHIDHWNAAFDVVLVDTGAGISPNVRYFVLAVEQVLVVMTPDPASITDAYALIKVMFKNHRIAKFDLLINQAADSREAIKVFRTVQQVVDRYLNVGLNYLGFIPTDPHLTRAVRQRKPVAELYPNAPATESFQKVGNTIQKLWQQQRQHDGRMTFFWRQLGDK